MGYKPGLVPSGDYFAVKVPVFSFPKLTDADSQLGPEMKSTGEVLGIDTDLESALFKGLLGAGYELHKVGNIVLFTVKDADKADALTVARKFEQFGYEIYATKGTCGTRMRAVRRQDRRSGCRIDRSGYGRCPYIVRKAQHSVSTENMFCSKMILPIG